MEWAGFAIVVAMIFLCGWGWGSMMTERRINAERKKFESNRLTVSVPMDPKVAADTLWLAQDLIRQAEAKGRED